MFWHHDLFIILLLFPSIWSWERRSNLRKATNARLISEAYPWRVHLAKANVYLIFVQRSAVCSDDTEDGALWLVDSLKQCGPVPGHSECGPWSASVSPGRSPT